MKGDVKLRHLVEVTVGGGRQAEPGQGVVERILNGLEGATPQDGVEQPVPSPGMGRPTGIDSRTERSAVDADHRQGVAKTPTIGIRCPAGTDRSAGNTPKNAVSLTTAS